MEEEFCAKPCPDAEVETTEGDSELEEVLLSFGAVALGHGNHPEPFSYLLPPRTSPAHSGCLPPSYALALSADLDSSGPGA